MGVGGWGGFGVKPRLSGAKGHFVGRLLYLHEAAGRLEDKDDASPRLLPLSEARAVRTSCWRKIKLHRAPYRTPGGKGGGGGG